eukprot:gi/632980654/ref/XP_007907155.1/ PREDICTED: uncharacterized protein LOC103188831 isoform X2 [Callorhinchus milii]
MTSVLTGDFCLVSHAPCDLTSCTKQDILRYFENTYDLDETLFTAVRDDSSFYLCPDRLRLPLVFYYCHPAVFYINKMMLAGLIKKRVDFRLETLFEAGVDEMFWDNTESSRMGGRYHWPELQECVEYRRRVRLLIREVIRQTPLTLPITTNSIWWPLLMGFEHERIHLETSSVLVRQMPVHLVRKPREWKYAPSTAGNPGLENFLITVSAAQVTYGKARDFPSYGWDNEYGEMTVETPEFEAARYLTTNAEFLRFVLAGGYQTHSYWSEEGWAWRQFRQAKHPTFWVCAKGCKAHCGSGLTDYSHCQLLIAPITNGGTGTPSSRGSQQEGSLHQDKASEFSYRAMFDVLPMPWDWPVEVNYHEAKAFCAWRGPEYRLPSEAEHQRMRGTQKPSEVGVSCDPIFCEDLEQKCNMNLLFGSPTPVNMFPPSEAGFYDVSGNIWEWTEDHFNGLPGFDTVYLYDDFSAPCFDSQHTVILGGSWCSTGDEASRFARFAFRRHFFQHLGFRLAKSRGPVKTPVQRVSTDIFLPGTGMKDHPVPEETMRVVLTPSSNIQLLYETEAREQEQLDWEYGDPSQASYCRQLVRLCREAWGQRTGQHHSALVLGSGTGLTSFLLTQHFDKVIGLDYCDRFIALSQQLQASGSLGLGVKVPDHLHRDRVVFKQLTWIPNEVGHHDLVLLDFLDRTQNPSGQTIPI